MKRRMLWVGVLLAVVLLVGGLLLHAQPDGPKIEVGMTEKDIERILGDKALGLYPIQDGPWQGIAKVWTTKDGLVVAEFDDDGRVLWTGSVSNLVGFWDRFRDWIDW